MRTPSLSALVLGGHVPGVKRRRTAPNLTIKTLARIAEAMGQKVVIRFVPKDPPPPAEPPDPHWTLAA